MASVPADGISDHAHTSLDDDLEKDHMSEKIEEQHGQKKSGLIAATIQGNITTELTHYERRAALINE